MKLNTFELSDLDVWLGSQFSNTTEREAARNKIINYLLDKDGFETNWETLLAWAEKVNPKTNTFAELWDKLENYSSFFVFNENTGDKYDSIVFDLDEDGKIQQFTLQHVNNEYADNLIIFPSAELKEVHFANDGLVFKVKDKYDVEAELWLQVRIAPQIEI